MLHSIINNVKSFFNKHLIGSMNSIILVLESEKYAPRSCDTVKQTFFLNSNLSINMIVTLIVVILGLWFLYDRFIDGKNLPPGPSRLPLVGTLLQMGKKKKKFPAPHIMMQEFCKEFGPVVTLQYGMKRQVVIDDYYTIRQIFQNDVWLNRPTDQWMMERSFGKQLGILWGNGEPWKDIRRFSIRTLRDFGFGKQKGQDAVMEEELDELFKRLDAKLATDKAISMSQFFTISVLNILWSMMAGCRFAHEDDKLKTLVKNIYDNTRFLNAGGNILMAYPFLRTVLRKLTGVGEARKKLIADMQKQFLDILEERRLLGYYKDEQRDFVDVFLGEIDKHRGDNSNANVYTDQQFVTVALDLFVAGSETTSNSLEFAMMFMILNPIIQERVRQEIDKEIGSTFPTVIMKNKMPYTEATLLEVQRMSSVAPMVVRSPSSDQTVNSYQIKKGTFTILNLYSCHMNKEVWGDPENFRPERFLNEKNEIVNTEKLVTFGQGKRNCMGEVLARATLFTYFVRFLQNYIIEKSPLHSEPTTQCVPGLTLAPREYYAVIKKRKF